MWNDPAEGEFHVMASLKNLRDEGFMEFLKSNGDFDDMPTAISVYAGIKRATVIKSIASVRKGLAKAVRSSGSVDFNL